MNEVTLELEWSCTPAQGPNQGTGTTDEWSCCVFFESILYIYLRFVWSNSVEMESGEEFQFFLQHLEHSGRYKQLRS